VHSQILLEIITGKKVTYKSQKIITKCLKQFDLRLFEEIRGSIQDPAGENERENENERGNEKEKHFKSFRFAS
jgi:hypothetical protein